MISEWANQWKMSFGNIHQEHMGKPVENEFWQDPSRALIITINKALSGSIQTLVVSFMTKPLVTPSGT